MRYTRLTVTAAVTVDTTRRTLVGTVYRYGETGYTSQGPLRVAATMPPPPVGLPMSLEHDRSVTRGHVALVDNDPERLRVAVRVTDDEAGDTALVEALDRTRAAFSFDIEDADVIDGEIVAGTWRALGQVAAPAFNSARIDQIAASRTTDPASPNPEGSPMTEDQIARLAELRALDTLTQAEAAELAELAALEAAEEQTPDDGETDETPEAELEPPARVAASAPAGLPRPHARRPRRTLDELYAALSRVHTGRSRVNVEAALSNLTQSANVWTSEDDYAGELWSGLQTPRRFVPLLTPAPLTSYKGTGWRWAVRPEVDDYAGDKTAVPSNAASTESVSWTAARLAGAHDFDRKFIDFGDTEFIASYYEAMRESYGAKSDAKAVAFIIGSATAITNTLSLAGGDTILDAALLAKLELENESAVTGITAGSPDYFLVNPTDYRNLMNIKASDVSAFIDLLGVTPDKFTPHSGVAANQVVAGVKSAGTFRELSGSPIRVETVNLVNGGVDGGVFGYYATTLNNAGGIVSVTVGA